ncbi:FecR family protein [Bacteroidota bacterium]
MAKIFAGEANEEELLEFEKWSQLNEENKQMTDMLKKNWDSVKPGDDKIQVDTDKAWMNLHSRLEKEQLIPGEQSNTGIRTMIPMVMRLAAAVILLVGLSTIAYMLVTPAGKAVKMTARTLEEQKFGLTLPDGSIVDLNADSQIKYKLQRSGIRMVTLDGEAYFDVNPDPYRPFIINAGNAIIEVTGTSFSVRTEPGKERIEVFVESGNVQFYRSRKQDRILNLKAGQMGVLEQNRLSEKSNTEPNHLSWKTRKLIFRETRLGDVAGVLNRTYSHNIRFTDTALEDCLFTGTFDQQPIDSVVRVIQVAFDLDLDRQGRAYVFSGEGCN